MALAGLAWPSCDGGRACRRRGFGSDPTLCKESRSATTRSPRCTPARRRTAVRRRCSLATPDLTTPAWPRDRRQVIRIGRGLDRIKPVDAGPLPAARPAVQSRGDRPHPRGAVSSGWPATGLGAARRHGAHSGSRRIREADLCRGAFRRSTSTMRGLWTSGPAAREAIARGRGFRRPCRSGSAGRGLG